TRLFSTWHRKYSSSFLYPIQFIDLLVSQYAFEEADVSRAREGSELQARTEEILDRVGRIGMVPLGFIFGHGGQSLEPERFCLIPEAWRGFGEVSAKIRALGFTE